MDAGYKARWIAALKSGEYKQGKGALRRREGNEVSYCCLGVLNDVYAKYNEIPAETVPWCNDDGDEYLPDALAWELGISRSMQTRLATMNDSGNYSFSLLADVIQEEL